MRESLDELIAGFALFDENNSWIGAKLADTHGSGYMQIAGYRVDITLEGFGK